MSKRLPVADDLDAGLPVTAEPRVPWYATFAVFLLALGQFVASSSRSPVGGESAQWIVEAMGIDPLPPLAHPLWLAAARLVGALPFETLSLRLNLLSAFCGALSVALTFLIAASIRHDKTFEEASLRRPVRGAGLVSGAIAALILLSSASCWIVSSRAHPVMLGLALALCAARAYQRYEYDARLWRIALAGLLWGLACTEVPACVLMTPVFLAAVLISLLRKGELSARSILVTGCSMAVGLVPLLILGARFMHTPAYVWREFDGYLQVLYYIGRNYTQVLLYSLPRVGWLTLFLFSLLPWFILFAFRPVAGRQVRGNVLFGSVILNGVLTAVLALIVLDGSVSPWSVSHHRASLVTPYVAIALWGGYLAGYWVILFGRPDRVGRVTPLRRALQFATPVAFAAVLGLAGWRHAPAVDTRPAAVAARLSQQMLEDAAPYRYLVGGHPLDDIIRIIARERGSKLTILTPPPSGTVGAYNRYLASLFPDSPRLASLARVGFLPLVQELVSAQSGLADQVAVIANPDLWAAAGRDPWPLRTLFVAGPKDVRTAAANLLKERGEFWSSWKAAPAAETEEGSLARPWAEVSYTHVAKVANNAGVLLEDQGREDDAETAYRAARSIDPDNISALLNLHNLYRRGKQPELEKTELELKAVLKRIPSQMNLWSLALLHGYVRSPEMFAGRGWAWAVSGKPNLGIYELRRAAKLSGDSAGAQVALGNLFLSQQMTADSEKAFRETLVKDPDNRMAIFGLARVALQKRDADGARSYLDRLEELKADPGTIAQYRAMMASLQGDNARALKLLQAAAEKFPTRTQIWAALAAVALEVGDTKTLDSAMQKLERTPRLPPDVRLSLARIALARNNRKAARSQLEYLLQTTPGHLEALEMLLRLDVQERRHDAAERDVARTLAVDGRNALANYVLGTMQLGAQQYALAESSLTVSLATERSPEALNDLAWLLGQRGEMAEAEKLARECLALDENHREAWDTLGFILLKAGKLDEAHSTLQKALQMTPGDPEVAFHLVQLMAKQGRFGEALALGNELMTKPASFDKTTYDELRALVEQLRTKV